ncbi:MAG: uroporphyrinogen decarboxylase family protein [Bacteroidales bacterium]|nr:uroporphyrinogen decarboxylase family protein [Bacteroidales bacterium]
MNSLTRTTDFIEGRETDRVPFHPILMRFAAKYAGIRYRDFCLSAQHKCRGNIRCAEDFNSDWVNTMSDPYAEAEAFGTLLGYPEDSLPMVRKYAIGNIDDIDRLSVRKVEEHSRLMERVREIEEYRRLTGEKYFVCGWVEGPLAEYCDIRDISLAMTDLYEYPEKVHKALDIITESAVHFITAQVKAGAHCIGIGDSVCSLISPELYKEFAFSREKVLVDHIHSLGVYAKTHICGNISAILADVIRTGTDIIDIDHRVLSVENEKKLLSKRQVFSGKSDPVSVIQDGDDSSIRENTVSFFNQADSRCIISAGCEITPETPIGNLRVFSSVAGSLSNRTTPHF